MQNQLTKERSKIVVAAFVSAVIFLVYGIIVAGVVIFITAIGGLECSRQDFGACALQNLFVQLLEVVLVLLFVLTIPVCFILTNGILTVAGLMQKEGKKDLIVASLVLNVMALIVPLCMLGAFSVIFEMAN